MSASESPTQPLVTPPSAESASSHSSPRSLSPLQFAASVYNRVLILMILYILSIGPMYWHWVDSMYLEGHPAVARFYYPLLVLCDMLPWLDNLVEWYLSFWI